ncbi:hypothetical protein PsorP6_002678 [Peronosclerospora sorghi]|uniref:Uncharacterized protein n=1 Tax=Peronosclerospora sorghi TaxID=230839 RepID=A0ACC0WTJ8_9STRA|nr:hypothetical protein PsorP6_002678 [Peronosclerospora sorghi]
MEQVTEAHQATISPRLAAIFSYGTITNELKSQQQCLDSLQTRTGMSPSDHDMFLPWVPIPPEEPVVSKAAVLPFNERRYNLMRQFWCYSLLLDPLEWIELLTQTECLDYVSPDVDACIEMQNRMEGNQELELTGTEFLNSPAIPKLPPLNTLPVKRSTILKPIAHPQRNAPRRPGLREKFPRQQQPTEYIKVHYSRKYIVENKKPNSRSSLVARRNSERPQSRFASRSLKFDAQQKTCHTARRKRASWCGRAASEHSEASSKRECKSARKSKACVIPGCTKGARSRGLCKRHGGGKRCTYSGCTRSDQGGGFCIAHGGGELDAPLKDVKTPLNLADFVKVTEVVKDAVSTGATRAAKVEDFAVDTELANIGQNIIISSDWRRSYDLYSPPKLGSLNIKAMTDLLVLCVKNVVLEVTRDDGEVVRSTLQKELVLRKEVGNARLVSGDAVLWVGRGFLCHEDSTLDSTLIRTVRVENKKRRFVFTFLLDATGKQFYDELKDQVENEAGMKLRKKKRKIRNHLIQTKGFTPVNTLKSPIKSPSPLHKTISRTPKRTPLADIGTTQRTPQTTLSPPFSVTTKESTSSLASTLRSPYRFPFQKKARVSGSPPHEFHDAKSPSSRLRTCEWLSPARSLKQRDGPTPPDVIRQTIENNSTQKKKGSKASPNENHHRDSVTGSINKRVRSLELMLNDEATLKESEKETEAKITSHFKNCSPLNSPNERTARKLDVSMDSVATVETDRADLSNLSASDSSTDEIQMSTHGLLNLGNYCYMNAIVQALAAIPGFMNAVQDEENLLSIVWKQPLLRVKGKTMKQLKTTFDNWRNSGETKHLPLQYALSQLLRLVITGSETSINPEPLKNVMGKKNPMFATHYQQDAHEFLLNLVTEYEKELVEMIHEVTKRIQEEVNSSSQVQRNSLFSFFRNGTNANENQHKTKVDSADAELELICRLPPAKFFRAELSRTLTCRHCGYSRKQVETFYDFSLDLPYYPVSEQEPTAEQEPQAPLSPERQCFCNLTSLSKGENGNSYYCCPKASCSYRENIMEAVGSAVSSTKITDGRTIPASSPMTPASDWPQQPASIELETLLQKQFETEVLELTCEKCKVGQEAALAYQVKSLPSVLVLHLKRFEVNPHTGALFKRCDPVKPPAVIYPTRSINNCASSGSDTRYLLKSNIHHLGKSIDEGHYVADVCDSRGQWIRRNDTYESEISEDYALQSFRSQRSCYMFFYVRSDINGDGKENVYVSRASPQDENDENSSQQREQAPSGGLKAFL